MHIEKRNAYILAGGKSRRLGVNKLHVRIDGRSLLERTLAVCVSCFDTVKLVTASRTEFVLPGCEIVLDSPAARGPMAGVIAALEDCQTEYCFLTAADLPDLSTAIIKTLDSRCRDLQYIGVMESGGLQPLCGFYNRSALQILLDAAKRGEYSLNKTMRFLRYEGIVPRSAQWRNINHPQDLALGDMHV